MSAQDVARAAVARELLTGTGFPEDKLAELPTWGDAIDAAYEEARFNSPVWQEVRRWLDDFEDRKRLEAEQR